MGGMFEVTQTLEITYLFERLEIRGDGRYAVISLKGPISTAAAPGADAPMGMSMKLQGEMSGEMEINLDGGFAGGMNITTTVTGLMSMMGQDVNMSMTMHVAQTLIELRSPGPASLGETGGFLRSNTRT
jgi:hypothetical protein